MERKVRAGLFALASSAIVLAGLLFAGTHDPAAPANETESTPYAFVPRPATKALIARLQREHLEAERSARRFLRAFFRFEVGESGLGIWQALRASTTSDFFRHLLRESAKRPRVGDFPPRASLWRLEVSFISSATTRALVTGSARRKGLPEEFSFIFSLGPRGWLASAPGE